MSNYEFLSGIIVATSTMGTKGWTFSVECGVLTGNHKELGVKVFESSYEFYVFLEENDVKVLHNI